MTLSRTARWTAGWLLAAAWVLSFPLLSPLEPHRLWGWCAACGYLAAAVAAALGRRRAALAAALLGAVAVPLLWLVLTGRGQSEVMVIERSGRLLLESGRLYVDRPATVGEYTPYLPGMALLGIPGALLGGGDGWAVRLLGDARIWCAAALFAGLWAGRRLLGAAPSPLLPVLVASPLVAMPLSVSGVDLPLAGLCCLALAAAAAGRPVVAGAALAGACALKWTALPAVAVAVALLAVCRGGRSAVRCGVTAAGGTALLVLPGALLQPDELWRQVFAFPTGRAEVATPAGSPFPGHLLAELGSWGWYLTTALLVLGGLAVALSLVVRPPRTLVAAADRLAIGLTTAFLLAPAGRFGYLALPVLLALWSRTAGAPPRPTRIVAGSRQPRILPSVVPGSSRPSSATAGDSATAGCPPSSGREASETEKPSCSYWA
ncbi:glycosyltransferase 87 family protein [Streptomyces sp. MB09-01]|uniref:glycosyltransferase 87 family protein n=1 Tax=Streptomyces sp. MB09-01 TaxID=3028666 RepID=UPI0029A7D336|nr:glycosyltransferase 87 family protein [Streptomyces sp. MB09-01]MDX3539997.1 glycosyltransferase 87 family protein [Streptomyces sp. MB09-01]